MLSEATSRIARDDVAQSFTSKTNFLPSGENAGAPCPPGGEPGFVTCLGSPPDDGTIQTVDGGNAFRTLEPRSLSGSDWKAIFCPSGDHAGFEPNWESCLGFPPVVGISQIPLRNFEWKAIRLPSGEKEGWKF